MRVGLLGSLEVHDDAGRPVEVPGTRLRALLVRLVLAGGRPVQVVSPEGSALGHLTMDDLLVARLHDLNEDTLRTRHFFAFGRARPIAGDAAPDSPLPPLD